MRYLPHVLRRGVDLYDNLPQRLATVRNLRRHPFEFYQRLGFTIVGVVPDANGPGKPDILMAKRIAPAAGPQPRGIGSALT